MNFITPTSFNDVSVGNLNFTGTLSNNGSVYSPSVNTNSTFTNIVSTRISSGALDTSTGITTSSLYSRSTQQETFIVHSALKLLGKSSVTITPFATDKFIYLVQSGGAVTGTSNIETYNTIGTLVSSIDSRSVLKYDSSMNFLYNYNSHTTGSTITILGYDSVENIYKSVSSVTTFVFNSTNGTSLLTTPTFTSATIALSSHSSTGSLNWVAYPGTAVGKVVVNTIDSSIYTRANPSSTFTIFDSAGAPISTLTTVGSVTNTDGYLFKYASTGTFLYYSRISGFASDSFSNDMLIDSIGNVNITGLTNSTQCNFYATNGSTILTTIGNTTTGGGTVFYAQYNSLGNLNFVHTLYCTDATSGVSAIPNILNASNGNIAFTCQLPGSEVYLASSIGNTLYSIGSLTLDTTNKRLPTCVYMNFSSNGNLLSTCRWSGVVTGITNNNAANLVPHVSSSGTLYIRPSQQLVGAHAMYSSNGNLVAKSGLRKDDLNQPNTIYIMNSSANLMYTLTSSSTLGSYNIVGENIYTTVSGNRQLITTKNSQGIFTSISNTYNKLLDTTTKGMILKFGSTGNLIGYNSIGTDTGVITINSVNTKDNIFTISSASSGGDGEIYDNLETVNITLGNYTTNTTHIMALYTSGSVSRTNRFDSNGDIILYGNMSVYGTKNFTIPHPTKENYILRHSCLETPSRGDTMYRYTVTTKNGFGWVPLPDYFHHLNENCMVMCSAVSHFGRAYGWVGEHLNIKSDIDGEYNVVIFGTRKDPGAMSFDTLGIEYSV